jgi:hypothetical protein
MKRKSTIIPAIFFAAILMAAFGVPAFAQFDNGSLVGTVHDSSGAAVGGAAVSATQVNTGIVTRTATNANGDYEFPDLKVGVYSLVAEATGFSPARARDINISVSGRVRIDLTLAVGGTETSRSAGRSHCT